MKHISPNKEKALRLTKQAAGTLAKVTGMIENNEYCPEVIQQLDSVCGLLHSAKRELLAGHLDSCVEKRMRDDKTGAIKELIKIYNLSN
jgi:DNA-binding FrmR family transcriptional regulator